MSEQDLAPKTRLRPQIYWALALVLGVSLGQSAVYAIVRIIVRLTAPIPLSQQSTTLNNQLSVRPLVDLVYQLLGMFFDLVPVLLAGFLLTILLREAARATRCDTNSGVLAPGMRWLGWRGWKDWRNWLQGVLLFAAIGIPGIAFFIAGRFLGITVQVAASGLNNYWWTIPVLVLSALTNAVLEETVACGFTLRAGQLAGWKWWPTTFFSAILRGSYHLYQGIGPFFGNLVMGLVFNEYFRRKHSVVALIVAHTLLDISAFVGYQLLPRALLVWLHLA